MTSTEPTPTDASRAAALARFNKLPHQEAERKMTQCCGSSQWVSQLLEQRPFASVEALKEAAQEAFTSLAEFDWLEAFEHHPRIGDIDSLRKKYAATAAWAGREQAGAAQASEAVLRALAAGNDQYFARYGFIFIVCATGKSADEMLALLRGRMNNDRAAELRIAGEEQAKVTALRLDKLLQESI